MFLFKNPLLSYALFQIVCFPDFTHFFYITACDILLVFILMETM